jgi:uncharacterized lipoprotein YddW (UPF0748 family)
MVLAAELASAEMEKTIILDACRYPSTQAARTAWVVSEKGSPDVQTLDVAGRPLLSLPCNFASNTSWRVSWDHPGRWDLSACQTVRVEFMVDRDRPAEIILYFRSGEGWFGRNVTAAPGATTIDIARQKFTPEGKPAGWDRIDAIRVSVQRDEAADRVIQLASITAVQRVGKIVIYRNDAGIQAESGVPQHVQQMSDRLQRLGLAHDILGDGEVAGGRLKGQAVVILPLNPLLSKPVGDALEKFVANGGKLLVCYSLPAPLDKLLGLKTNGAMQGEERLFALTFQPAQHGATPQPVMRAIQQSGWARQVTPLADTRVRGVWIDQNGRESMDPAITSNAAGIFIGHVLMATDQTVKDRLLLEILGELWPGLWESIYRMRVAALGKGAGFKSLGELQQKTLDHAGGRTNALLVSGLALAREAAVQGTRGEFAAAAILMDHAQQDLLRAYASSIPPRLDEFRAVWCHSPHGAGMLPWEEAMKKLADAGFKAVIPNMLWGGSAAFDSKVLPHGVGIKRDLLAECLVAAKKHGIAVHVWKVNWNLWYNCPPAFKEQLRKAGRMQADLAGNEIDWLCPSHPDNQKLELDSLVDLATRYDIAGIHLDYIRYPGDNGCFCSGCRERFEEHMGRKVERWPADVTSGGLLREPFRQFRRDNITRLVAAVSGQVRKARPGVKISAAVFWHWPSARNSIGQDWKLWVDQGYVDFVCPMQYTDNTAAFAAQCAQTTGWVGGKVPVMPGIGATLGLAPDGTLQQVLATRGQPGCGGFVLFNYEPNLLDHLDLLRLGATRKSP